MGFSVRVAPGVRIRASSRGVRTSLGPRAARIHVGAGRTAISTGAGPFSYSTTLTGSRSGARSGSSSRGASAGTGASSRQLAQAAKAQEAQGLLQAMEAISTLHHQEFAPATRPVAPPPPPVDFAALEAKHEKAALAGVSWFDRAGRAAAKTAASAAAQAEAAHIAASNAAAMATYQENLDMFWTLLTRNDPDTVLAELARAFEDNDAAAAPLGVEAAEASLVVLVPGEEALPERKPDLTAAGNLSLKKLTKAETADWYRAMVSGYILATVKEAFAVAPALQAVRVIAARKARVDSYGRQTVEALLAVRIRRDRLTGIRWRDTQAAQILLDASDELTVNLAPRTNAVRPIDLAANPAVGAALKVIDLDELTT